VVRVSQQVALALSTRVLTAWSFADSLNPTIALTDRRGNGLPGATIRFVPRTAFDSLIVTVAPATGVSNPTTGLMAPPKLVSIGNGTARVLVQAIGADGNTVVAVDSLQETVRQVARRVQVEPLRAVITSTDSIPIKPVARDARGAIIPDATISITPSGIPLSANGLWAGPVPGFGGVAINATITPTLSGNSLPAANPLAPQIPVAVDVAQISIFPVQTVTAGLTSVSLTGVLLDSLANPAFNRWIRFAASFGPAPDSVAADGNGIVNAIWTPRDSAGRYTLTGVRGAAFPLVSLADSAGRIVVRTSIIVQADVPSQLKTTVGITAQSIPVNGTRQVTVAVKDKFGNPVTTATTASFAITTSAGRGTLSAGACSLGICTFTYTAPATAGPDVLTVKIGGLDVVFSPIPLTIF